MTKLCHKPLVRSTDVGSVAALGGTVVVAVAAAVKWVVFVKAALGLYLVKVVQQDH